MSIDDVDSGSDTEYEQSDNELSISLCDDGDSRVNVDLDWIHVDNLNAISQRKYYKYIYRKYQHVVFNKKFPGLTIRYVPHNQKLRPSNFVTTESEWEKQFHHFVPLYIKGQPDILHWPGYIPHKDHDRRNPLYVVRLRYFCQPLEETKRTVRSKKTLHKPGYRTLYTERRRFLCDPALVCPEALHMTSSVLFPKVYKWTKPDAQDHAKGKPVKVPKLRNVVQKILKFDHTQYKEWKNSSCENSSSDSDSSLSQYSDTEISDSDFSEKPNDQYESDVSDFYSASASEFSDTSEDMDKQKISTLTPQMKMLLNVNVDNIIQEDSIKKEVQSFTESEEVPKKWLKLSASVSQIHKSPREELLSSLKKRLGVHTRRKKQVANNISFILDTLSRLKSEYMYHVQESVELQDEIHARETLQTIEHYKKLPRKIAMQVNKIHAALPENISSSQRIVDSEKKIFAQTHLQEEHHVSESKPTPLVKIEENIDNSENQILKETTPKHMCAICKKEYTDKRSFTDHVNQHTSKKGIHKCDECPDRYFTSTQSFKNHMTFHTNGNIYSICETCKKKFELPAHLKSHMKVHQEPTKQCRVHDTKTCGKMFTFDGEQRTHELLSWTAKKIPV